MFKNRLCSHMMILSTVAMVLGIHGNSYADTWNNECNITVKVSSPEKASIVSGSSTTGAVLNDYNLSNGTFQFTCPQSSAGTQTLNGPVGHTQDVSTSCSLTLTGMKSASYTFQPQSFGTKCSPVGYINIDPMKQNKTNIYFQIMNVPGWTASWLVTNMYCNTKTTGFSSITSNSGCNNLTQFQ